MAYKRNRSEFEHTPNPTPSFILYGRALPPDSSTRDDGSFVPLWKQEVLDERGRKRLHGAFTGGFSAGYFNTVGSKEGWTPAAFKSSRAARASAGQARPEDFMDDEDLRDVEEARKLETSQNYSGIGGPEDTLGQPRSLTDLLVPSMEETIGTTLLKKMGWKKGQGIGPRTLRKARDFEGESLDNSSAERYLFAPDNSRLVSFKRKDTPQGLGYIGELSVKIGDQTNERTNNDEIFPSSRSLPKPKKSTGHAFGVGVLNDDGDDEDPYEIRPKHLYNRVIGGDRPKKPVVVRPQKGRHVFIPQKAAAAQASFNMRKCHDGRLPLPGFILSDVGVQTTPDVLYPPPQVPSDWKPTLESSPAADAPSWANDTITKLDPRARGDILGETPLPGKSVFDFLTSDARNRIAQMTGKQNLPPGLGETAVSTNRSTIADIVPALDTGVAMTALKSGYMPYGDDQEKQSRYRLFLEIKARLREGLPDRKYGMNTQDWVKEMNEFVGAARIFKPLTGTMATRFTTSSLSSNIQGNMGKSLDSETVLSRPSDKPEDPAEAAAKLSMYGPLTRSFVEFSPCRLLCKRFNVQYIGTSSTQPDDQSKHISTASSTTQITRAASRFDIEPINLNTQTSFTYSAPEALQTPIEKQPVDTEKNEALECEKAAEEVFRNVFGDSDDDSDDE